MSTGLAAVQARIAQIHVQFGAPVAVRPAASPAAGPTGTAPAASSTAASSTAASSTAASSTASFSQALAVQTAKLSAAAPGSTRALPPTGPGSSGSLGERAVAAAREHLGTPYVWGGSAPGGFDCSGLPQYAYQQVGIDLPRVSNDQKNAGRAVSAAEARPGDLVFFERGQIDHIGMYAGAGQWVVAPKTGDVVKMQDVDLSKATTIRRVTSDDPVPGLASAPTSLRTGESAYAGLFAAAGARHGVSPALLTAVARAESGFNPSARSPAGAQGLMQLMPATARGLGLDPWNPAQAVDGAARLLKQNLARFGSTELALAAYNAGPGAVAQHGGIPPFRETQDYVAKIMREVRGMAA